MTISYNWLSEYLPESIEPEKLSQILTSIGLEVESMEKFEEVKGSLKGLVAGEVVSCEKHPEADKLKLTKVNVGNEALLNIVCGAPNVAAGQKVIVATIGTTIYPVNADSITMKKAKIRGAESEGMICAEDEIGFGQSHDGIKILPESTVPGTPISEIFKPFEDYIFEIGLTPNRMDAMSHLGVARDVCAYLSYHNKKTIEVKSPYSDSFASNSKPSPIKVSVENSGSCKRYCGISISNVAVNESPAWLQQKLKSIGLKPINNIVDITNFILHESGQPLHAFDAAAISGNHVIVKNVNEGTVFKTLDEKERKLLASDLMICNEKEPMCIAGVYGGINSGVSSVTKNIFLESAFFEPSSVRKTSLHHELRTDAAVRFEKGVDISNTVNVLKRAALMIQEIAGGEIEGEIIDIYPQPKQQTSVAIAFDYIKKLSGKYYPAVEVKRILTALGFGIENETADAIELSVPFHKSDISIPADIVEEVMRIDGLDNVEIPSTITIAPSVEVNNRKHALREKLANYLVGLGFNEIFTNSITNSAYYDEDTLIHSVKMMNSLSNELDIMRPQMIQSGLEVIAHNINRKNHNLRLFEFGKTYKISGENIYEEKNNLVFYVTGNISEQSWNSPAHTSDFFYLKGAIENVLKISGVNKYALQNSSDGQLSVGSEIIIGKNIIGRIGEVSPKLLKQFDIKHSVLFAELNWDMILAQKVKPVQYKEISKFPAVNRDLALVVDKNVSYSQLEQIALSGKPEQLRSVQLFDIFESDKLGAGKKSMAVSFTFLDEVKTLTDKEIDVFMNKIISAFEKNLQAEIRK